MRPVMSEKEAKRYWRKLVTSATIAGREVVERSLCLYYAARDEGTPLWARSVIYGALGYFISIIDAVPDVTPVLGYCDDLKVILAALATTALYITPEIKEKASIQSRAWFDTADEPAMETQTVDDQTTHD